MKRLKTFIYGILAGMSISLGGSAFLAVDHKVLGSALFAVGLFTICTQGLNLFTGKVCYVFDKDLNYALDCVIILIGNLIGCLIFGSLLLCTRIAPAFTEKAAGMVATKLSDGLLSIFLLSLFCNLLIYIAVDGFNYGAHEFGKYLAILFGIIVFITCGFEHCVANMYYITVAKAWSLKAAGYMLVMVLGNAVGGVIFPLMHKLFGHVSHTVAPPRAVAQPKDKSEK